MPATQPTAELKALAQDRHEAYRRPAVEELGALDLGPFADRDFVSPATAAQAHKAMNSGTSDRDELAGDDGRHGVGRYGGELSVTLIGCGRSALEGTRDARAPFFFCDGVSSLRFNSDHLLE